MSAKYQKLQEVKENDSNLQTQVFTPKFFYVASTPQIPMQKLNTNYESDSEEEDMEMYKDLEKQTNQKKAKANKVHCCLKCCTCVGIFCTIFFIITAITLGLAIGLFAHALDECIHPRHSSSSIIKLGQNIKSLDLQISIGTFKVKIHDNPDSLPELVITKGAKTPEFLSDIRISQVMAGTKMTVTISSPPFELSKCEIVETELYLPRALVGFNLTTKVETGSIELEAERNPTIEFSKLDLFVHTGYIEVDSVVMEVPGTIDIATKLGAINLEDLQIANGKLNVRSETGAIHIENTVVNELDLYTESGCVMLEELNVKRFANADCRWGGMALFGIHNYGITKLSVESGELRVFPGRDFKGAFTASSASGSVTLDGVASEEQAISGVKGEDNGSLLTLSAASGNIWMDFNVEREDFHHYHHHEDDDN